MTSRRSAPRARAARRGPRTLHAIHAIRCLGAAWLVLAAGCGERPAASALPDDFNVVLIVIDTLGAEHVGGFQNPGLTHTPHMDRLAERGVVFTRAYAPAPWTQPSVASLFTGAMPSRHGLRALENRMHPEVETLAQALRPLGFATHAVVSNLMLKPQFSFDRGFSSYDVSAVRGQEGISSARVTSRSLAWLDRHADARFFLFAHYYDPHYMYRHHPEFEQTAGYAGPLVPKLGMWELRSRRASLTPADIDYLVGLHREEIAFTDAHIGRLLDALEERGLAEETLVILTSDHGEEIMRHGWIGHTRTLYEELLHVPMIVSLPGAIAPAVVEQPVSLIDIMPTVLELAGDREERSAWEGVSLATLLTAGEPLPAGRRLPAEVSFVPPSDEERAREKIAFKTSLLSDRWKVIHDLTTGSWELYDLETDPEELTNLFGSGHAAEAPLVAALEEWEAGREGEGDGAPGAELDAEAIEQLRALGYIE